MYGLPRECLGERWGFDRGRHPQGAEWAQREPRRAWVVSRWCTCLCGDRTECAVGETQERLVWKQSGGLGKVPVTESWWGTERQGGGGIAHIQPAGVGCWVAWEGVIKVWSSCRGATGGAFF